MPSSIVFYIICRCFITPLSDYHYFQSIIFLIDFLQYCSRKLHKVCYFEIVVIKYESSEIPKFNVHINVLTLILHIFSNIKYKKFFKYIKDLIAAYHIRRWKKGFWKSLFLNRSMRFFTAEILQFNMTYLLIGSIVT